MVKVKDSTKNKKIMLTALGLAIIIGALTYTYMTVFRDDDVEQKIVKTTPIKIADNKHGKTTDKDDSQTDEDSDQPIDSDEQNTEDNSKKPVSQQIKSTAKPSVNTDYGHSQESPLPLNETTNTTCSVSPGSVCKIVLTNQTTKQVREFASQTSNDQGIAVWQWKGEYVGAGTWILEAVSVDKKSDKETIYIR